MLDPGYSVLEIETMSFNTFYAKEEAYRNAVALDMFFKNQGTLRCYELRGGLGDAIPREGLDCDCD